MTTNFTTIHDFAAITDGLESVTLLRRETPGGPGEAVPHALRRAIEAAEVVGENRRTIESDGRYTAADASWSLPAAEVAAAPRLGDVLLDAAGRRWTILETRLVALAARWRCRTRELSIAFGLEDAIDVLAAEYFQSESGAVETAWNVLRTGLRGRIQPLETQIAAGDSAPSSVASVPDRPRRSLRPRPHPSPPRPRRSPLSHHRGRRIPQIGRIANHRSGENPTMNLAKYLHERWANAFDLNALLPAEKVFTGLSGDSAPPYAVIAKESAKPFTRHNDGSSLEKATMRFQIYHSRYDAGLAVSNEIKKAFDGAAFDLDDGCKVLTMLRVNESENQINLEEWQFTSVFLCTVFLPSGY